MESKPQENMPWIFHIIRTFLKMIKRANYKVIFCFLFFVMFITVLWIQAKRITLSPYDASNQDSVRYVDLIQTQNMSEDIKFILLWTRSDFSPFYFLKKGQKAFLDNNCTFNNCYVTDNKDFFDGDTTRFHAIFFNARSFAGMQFPETRSTEQKFIFTCLESSDNEPVCDKTYDGYFNWTATYRLDSDIPMPYVAITNNKNEIIGPRKNTEWDEITDEDFQIFKNKELLNLISNKTKSIAWFVSNCESRSQRRKLVKLLNNALTPFLMNVDVYGDCGPLKCPRENKAVCDEMLKRDYYFYLSFENSFAEDYVTEKLLTALQHYTVPIVYGAANYSRFLPPGSYLDATKYSPKQLAFFISSLVVNQTAYAKYFWWRNHYKYHNPSTRDNICNVCAALNNRTLFETKTVYKSFRRWWNPEYVSRCSTF